MTQLTTITESTRRIQLSYVEISRVLTIAANSPHAAAPVIADRMATIASELESVERHARRARQVALDAAERARAVTVCHTRGEPITECATAPSSQR
jgi:hypothetical protein